jgi:hypothetical protein
MKVSKRIRYEVIFLRIKDAAKKFGPLIEPDALDTLYMLSKKLAATAKHFALAISGLP